MELKDLVGKHDLSGVDMDTKTIKGWLDKYERCQVINFVLDGKTYTAIEDPDDGFRSRMREIAESNIPITNTFPCQKVLARMRDNDEGEVNDILELIDMQTSEIVLAVGTENTYGYYPCFISEFIPENMGINRGVLSQLYQVKREITKREDENGNVLSS